MHCQSEPYLSWKVHSGSLHVEDATGDERWNTDISNDATMKTLFPNTYPVVTEICRKAKRASLDTPKIYFSPQKSIFYIFWTVTLKLASPSRLFLFYKVF